MKSLHRTIYYDTRSQQFRLYHLTDIHLGAAACDENLFKRYLQAIEEDDHALWIGGGDYVDAIARKGDRRYQESTFAAWLYGKDDAMGFQRDYLVDLLTPVMDKCLGLVKGNHEQAALKWYDRNLYWEIVAKLADRAGKPPEDLALGVQGFVVLKFRRAYSNGKYGGTRKMVIYTHHGYGGGRLPGGHALALGRVLGDYECDLALLGHRHVTQLVSKAIVIPSKHGGSARIKTRYGLYCGTFLGAYVEPSGYKCPVDTYPEHAGLPPSILGSPMIVIKPDVKHIQVVLSGGFGGGGFVDAAMPVPAFMEAAA